MEITPKAMYLLLRALLCVTLVGACVAWVRRKRMPLPNVAADVVSVEEQDHDDSLEEAESEGDRGE